jgi:hypothetical protein
MRFNKHATERRSSSKKAALQYVAAVGDKLNSQRIKHLINFLQHNGWHEEELTDLVVAQALWDDYAWATNDIEGVVLGISSLTEAAVNLTLGAFKRLIYESLLVETTCPFCGDNEAYVGFNSVECPNHKCKAFSRQQASDVKRSRFNKFEPTTMSTQDIVNDAIEFLRSLGHTNVKAEERWEKDGVFEIWSDQTLKDSTTHPGKVGWHLDVSGQDLEGVFTPGMSFIYQTDSKYFNRSIDSWDELKQLANQFDMSST